MTVNRATRKSRFILSAKSQRSLAILSAATAMVAMTSVSHADTWGENGSSTVLSNPGAWTDETVPPSGNSAPPQLANNDVAQFDSLDTLTGSQTYTLGG